jgi:hypothetical protein
VQAQDRYFAFIFRDLNADVCLCSSIRVAARGLPSAHAHAVAHAGESFVLLCTTSTRVFAN